MTATSQIITKTTESLLALTISERSPSCVPAITQFLEGQCVLTGEELIDLLCQDPELKELYHLSAGVGEGYSIETHSRMVVSSFEQEFTNRPETEALLLKVGISRAQFLFFLALHDIGKGLAVDKIGRACPERKRLELDGSIEVIQRWCSLLNQPTLLTICEALLYDDIIGDYLKGSLQPEEAVIKIKEIAEKANIASADFVSLMTLFHQVDAGSYPFLRYRIFEIHEEETVYLNQSHYPQILDYKTPGREKIKALQEALLLSSL